MKNSVPAFLLNEPPVPIPLKKGGRAKLPFIDATLRNFAGVIRTSYIQWETASRHGFLQRLDPRLKIIFLIYFIIIASLKVSLLPELVLLMFVIALAVASRLDMAGYLKKVLFFGFFFGFLIALPSSVNLITDGRIVVPLIQLSGPYDFWIYHIPSLIGLTMEGLNHTGILTLRVMNSVALSLLVLYTTRFSEAIKALRVFRVPSTFLLIITLSYKYIFIFAKTVEEIYLSMKSRLTGHINNTDAQQLISGRIAFMFRKTQIQCDEVYKAMLSRGFTDTVRLYHFRSMAAADWTAAACFLAMGIIFLWM